MGTRLSGAGEVVGGWGTGGWMGHRWVGKRCVYMDTLPSCHHRRPVSGCPVWE